MKYEYETVTLKLNNAGMFARNFEEWEIRDQLNAMSKKGWIYIDKVERIRDGYTVQVILIFRRALG